MSFLQIAYDWIEHLFIKILKAGPIPKHIAIIMDGNRRYSKKKSMAKIIDGHNKGYQTFENILESLNKFGITEVSIYCFSIENFKRSQEEIDDLFNLFRRVLQDMLDKDEFSTKGICVRIIGNLSLSLIPDDLKALLAKIVLGTRNNKKSFLNIAFSYTSSDEITNTVRNIIESVRKSELKIEDISENVINDSLYTRHSSEPDLLIRTSGEIRFSDFLLWQISTSCIYFSDKLWPEFSTWDLIMAILYYQRCNNDLELAAKKLKRELPIRNSRITSYLSKLDQNYQKCLEKWSVSGGRD